jgi:hypothetical protein
MPKVQPCKFSERHCPYTVSVESKSGICTNCNNRLRYAINKSIAYGGIGYVVERRRKLTLWNGTLETVTEKEIALRRARKKTLQRGRIKAKAPANGSGKKSFRG